MLPIAFASAAFAAGNIVLDLSPAHAQNTSPNYIYVSGENGNTPSGCGKSGRGGSSPSESINSSFLAGITYVGYVGGQSQGGNGSGGNIDRQNAEFGGNCADL